MMVTLCQTMQDSSEVRIMVTKYGMSIKVEEFNSYKNSLKNKIYKLLPLREENLEWQKHLSTILIEVSGLGKILGSAVDLIELSAKLEGLFSLTDFVLYRKTIFECLNLVDGLGR